MKSDSQIIAKDFRMSYESAILFGSLSFMMILIVIIMNLSPIILIVFISISALWIKIRQKQFLGNSVKVGEKNFPDVHKAAVVAAKKLSMDLPDVFVKYDEFMNAFAIGFFGKKSVVLHSKLVESMDSNELVSVLGHEFSHIKCGHTSWLVITNSANTVSIPIVSNLLEIVFQFWSRSAEYTSDRGGLIACGNLDTSISALLKLATGKKLAEEVDIAEFLKQVNDENTAAKLSQILLNHPYFTNRIKYLSDFYHSDIFKNIHRDTIKREKTLVESVITEASEFLKTAKNGEDLKLNIQKISKKIAEMASEILTQNNKKPLKTKNNGDKNKAKSEHDKSGNRNREEGDKSKANNGNGNNKEKAQVKKGGNGEQKKNHVQKPFDYRHLFKSVLNGDVIKVSELLSQNGADPNYQDKEGDTPLHLAVILEYKDLVEILLRHGAFINQINSKGETPLSIAEKSNNKVIVSWLKTYGQHC